MSKDIRAVKNITDLIGYFSTNLGWDIDIDDFDDIEDVSYDFDAADIGLKEESFAKISSLRQLQPLVDGQQWGIFCVEFDSNKFEPSALKKILSGLIPRKRNSADHAVWCQQDLLFICNWGTDNNSTIGLAHFEDREGGLPQIKMFSCAPALEDFTQIENFEKKLALLAWPKNTSNIDEWREVWSSAFTTAYKQTIQDSSTLTIRLAAEAQNIRNRILDTLKVETKHGYVHLLFEKFRDTLIQDMTEQQFADMYAQTVVYGLFSARCLDKTQEDFSVAEAIDCIPNTNPFLKNLMKECFGAESRSKLSFDELEIGNVVDLLKNTRTDAIIQDFNRQTGGGKEDPVIHFYEEFLTAYDKAQKVQRGVYYTPQPVVNYIVRAVDSILKTEFDCEDGLASENTRPLKIKRISQRKIDGVYKQIDDSIDVHTVQILDPATGTGTFLRQTILQIHSNFLERHKDLSKDKLADDWNDYVDRSLLTRINGFELMMAPYAVAHMKLAMVLKDTGYLFTGRNRLRVFLTNTIEEPGRSDGQMTLWDDPLATESIEANEAKKNSALSVVMGNPPYSNSSTNQNQWILNLIDLYKEGLNERKLNLDEDSIKFLRYGQYVVERSGQGILAYISNNTFINGVTHRKMRYEMMKTFDYIYILNLHGDSNRLEKCPDGSKDENVFDIKQGVSINIFVRKKEHRPEQSKVYYMDMYGLQDTKLNYLQSTSFGDCKWEEITPTEPYYFFDNKDYSASDEYEGGFSVADLFIEKNTGIQTKNDSLVLCSSRQEIEDLILDFVNLDEMQIKEKYGIKGDGTWSVSAAKSDLLRSNYVISPILFRPFDIRYTALTDKSSGFLGRPRYSTMRHMFSNNENYALLVGRQNKSETVDSFLITNTLSEMKCAERTIQSYHLPLYINCIDMLSNSEIQKANFSEDIIKKIEKILNLNFEWNCQEAEKGFSALDVLDYIYGILYVPAYREKYKNQLKIDFPRIPYPISLEHFNVFKEKGRKLRKIHLMQDDVNLQLVNIDLSDNLLVDSPKYKNGTIYFSANGVKIGDVPEHIWTMGIGGYMPLQKWLKDRKGWTLDKQDVYHFAGMIVRLDKTFNIMKELDELYKKEW